MTRTIFALATPHAKSGVAVLRVSGPQAIETLEKITGKSIWKPNRLTRASLKNGQGAVIDEALAVVFKAPKSFTGEDVVELHTHGSLAVIRELLGLLSGLPGLVAAERGEFTRRAFLNGKMDLLEVEGLADLIDAETSEQKSQALRQMQGQMSGFYEQLRRDITVALAHLEAYIDFPDEEIPEHVYTQLGAEVRGVMATIERTLARHREGERIREGINVVILGAPNAGKSSLLNALSKRDAAIVSPEAGTTRDMIEMHLDIGGYPVILVDTAGLREAEGIEAEGVRRAKARAEDADIKLVLFDGTAEPDAQSLALLGEGAIAITTKSDLSPSPIGGGPGWGHPRSVEQVSPPPNLPPIGGGIAISTATGQGLDQLLSLLESRIRDSFTGEGALITRTRHKSLLATALRHLERFFMVKELELQCEELRLAAGYIGNITGKIAVDDILDVVFREFCIGK